MNTEKKSSPPPKGYIQVSEHLYPENGRKVYFFTQWDGKEWIPYEPKSDDEWQSLVTGRMISGGNIRNTY